MSTDSASSQLWKMVGKAMSKSTAVCDQHAAF